MFLFDGLESHQAVVLHRRHYLDAFQLPLSPLQFSLHQNLSFVGELFAAEGVDAIEGYGWSFEHIINQYENVCA